ncbi:hypothetical protein E1212_07815 [Jiangella ureilytica]|uniref:LVIVD repeat-containing protein n=1 Tax=Jiangella ureilytica TaxID=2530374 RepID=A0A4R4RS69_9ACTN|nr:hypothetical protein [Jiangella ureilytica]TDC52750.1 hypothetical protein E1212_07815 [Jiangella ureilytica]
MRLSESRNMRLVGHSDLNGMGDGMHINVRDGYAYFAHQGNGGTSIVDVRDPREPKVVNRIPAPPNTHSHKVQIVGDILLVNRERQQESMGGDLFHQWMAGISVYDLSDPVNPREISFWSCAGRGVHRMVFWEEPYVYACAGASQYDNQILAILDLSDPARPVEVGRWGVPGMRRDEAHLRTWTDEQTVKFHHGIPRGDRLYCGWWDIGLVILDIADKTNPSLVASLNLNEADGPSRNTHTVCPWPGTEAVIVTDEATKQAREGIPFYSRVVDITDEKQPAVLARFPTPEGTYPERAGRFGPHNIHEPRPGSFQDPNLVFMTYFNAGLRVFDVSDVSAPVEVAFAVPETPPGLPAIQLNDLYVSADGLAYVSDRFGGGMYIFELTGI